MWASNCLSREMLACCCAQWQTLSSFQGVRMIHPTVFTWRILFKLKHSRINRKTSSKSRVTLSNNYHKRSKIRSRSLTSSHSSVASALTTSWRTTSSWPSAVSTYPSVVSTYPSAARPTLASTRCPVVCLAPNPTLLLVTIKRNSASRK